MKKITLALAFLMLLLATVFAAEIPMVSVDSSLIAKIGYDPGTQTMAVQMLNSSDTYVYEEVPPAVFDGFLAAESKGTYFVQNVKGKFKTQTQD